MKLIRVQWLVSLGPPLFVLVAILSSWLPHTAGVLGHEGEHLFLTIVLLAGIIPFSIFVAILFRALGRLQRQLQRQAIVEERERISRELHDNLAQVMGYVSTKAQAALEMLAARKQEAAIAQIEELGAAARDLYSDVREAILGLRAAQDLDQGLQAALSEYVRQFSQESGVQTEVIVDGPFPAFLMGSAAEPQLLRIIQEALSNVRKHAAARRAWVRFQTRPDCILVAIEDDGRGFNPSEPQRQQRPRFGLLTMRERAEAIGARFQVDSSLGQGTRVLITLPRQDQGRKGNHESTSGR